MNPKITVVGSISTDFVVKTTRTPEIGETIQGESFQTNFGGKGANQAIAAARLGAEVTMLGAVGKDSFGQKLIENLNKNHIDTQAVQLIEDAPSGSAIITVVDGDNAIIYVAGANDTYTPDVWSENKEVLNRLKMSEMILVQNEIPEATVKKLMQLSADYNILLLYNPAPARPLKKRWIDQLAFLTPNETEFKTLFPERSLQNVLESYPNKLIVTLGSKGAVFHDGNKVVTVPASKVERVVDTTGAGDTFNGALAVAITSGHSIEKSIQFANEAAALSIQKPGAQKGMPTIGKDIALK
ncbi:ribokinase [Marinilactibacillus kalidii]|uniref:ribokinase n=1 Tax=Marinilactibacillus kalidii TaxID=2820274 RepID=UPI001ABEA65D|nr:ribokinase [Marinilactibacillus kalidii]